MDPQATSRPVFSLTRLNRMRGEVVRVEHIEVEAGLGGLAGVERNRDHDQAERDEALPERPRHGVFPWGRALGASPAYN